MAGASGSLLGQAYVRVRIDNSMIADGLSSIRHMVLGTLGEIAGVAGGILAAAGIQSMTHALADLGKMFISTNDQLQQYTVSLGVLFKSEANAKDMIKQIQDMAAKTPFRMDNLTQAVVQLKVFGFEAEKLIPMMKTIGDAAAASPMGMADGIQRISYAFGQINTTGHVMARQMNQLALAGVPGWQILAEQSGKSIDKIREMARKGMLDSVTAIPQLLAGMEQRFGGMMDKQSRTWSGLKSTIQDDLQFMLRDIGKPMFEAAHARLASMVDWLNVPSGAFTPQAIEFRNKLTGIVRELTAIADVQVDKGLKWLQSDAPAQFAVAIKESAEWLWEISKTSFSNLVTFFSSDGVKTFAKEIKEVAIQMGKLAAMEFKNITAWMNSEQARKMGSAVRDLATDFIGLASNFGSLAVGVVVMWRIAGAIRAVAVAMIALKVAAGGSLAILGGTFLVALGLLVAAFIGAKLEGKNFGDYMVEMFGRITAGAGEAQDAVSKLQRQMQGEKEFNTRATETEKAASGDVDAKKVKVLKEQLWEAKKAQGAASVTAMNAEDKAAKNEGERIKKLEAIRDPSYRDALGLPHTEKGRERIAKREEKLMEPERIADRKAVSDAKATAAMATRQKQEIEATLKQRQAELSAKNALETSFKEGREDIERRQQEADEEARKSGDLPPKPPSRWTFSKTKTWDKNTHSFKEGVAASAYGPSGANDEALTQKQIQDKEEESEFTKIRDKKKAVKEEREYEKTTLRRAIDIQTGAAKREQGEPELWAGTSLEEKQGRLKDIERQEKAEKTKEWEKPDAAQTEKLTHEKKHLEGKKELIEDQIEAAKKMPDKPPMEEDFSLGRPFRGTTPREGPSKADRLEQLQKNLAETTEALAANKEALEGPEDKRKTGVSGQFMGVESMSHFIQQGLSKKEDEKDKHGKDIARATIGSEKHLAHIAKHIGPHRGGGHGPARMGR